MEPEALAKKPALPDFLSQYVEAFSILSAQRQITAEGYQPIDISHILFMASEMDIDIDDRFTFIKHICAMDRTFRKHFNKKGSSG